MTSSRIRVDASEFGALLKAVDEFDHRFQLDLRKEMRAAAQPLIGKMRDAVRNAPKGRGSRIRQTLKKQRSGAAYDVVTNTSDLIARGISLPIVNSKAGVVTVRFASSSKLLPGKVDGKGSDRKAMIRAFNKKKPFRHPVIGTTTEPAKGKGAKPGDTKPRPRGQWHWAEQQPRPYFGSVILAEGVEPMEDAIRDAWDKATDFLNSRIR